MKEEINFVFKLILLTWLIHYFYKNLVSYSYISGPISGFGNVKMSKTWSLISGSLQFAGEVSYVHKSIQVSIRDAITEIGRA